MILEKTCYTNRGQFYRGSINTTIKGLPCLPWKIQPVHNLLFTHPSYSDTTLESNYCRNPNHASRIRPWCYIHESNGQWQYCNVSRCDPPLITTASYPLGS